MGKLVRSEVAYSQEMRRKFAGISTEIRCAIRLKGSRFIMRLAYSLLGGATAIYLAICSLMYFNQRRLTYFPDSRRVSPAELGLSGVSEITLPTPDGETLVAWYAKAKPGEPTLLYFHGNAGSLVTRVERVRKYVERGRGILMLTYRGFGGSTGYPSEASNIADAKMSYDYLIANGLLLEDIILYGESLGSGVAVQTAAARPAGGLVLDAPFTSLADVAAERYPWVPVRWLMSDPYRSDLYLSKLKVPVLVIHGDRDDTVPVEMGRQVYELAGGPKELAIIKDAGHSDHYSFGSFDIINAWIDKLRIAAMARKASVNP